MPYITINAVNKGTQVIDPENGHVTSSAYGHTWYNLHDNPIDIGDSYGFGPEQPGMPIAQGQTKFDDSANYIMGPDDYSSSLIYITPEQQAILEDFGKHPTNYGFSNKYNGVSNSCVDYVWTALAKAGITPIESDRSYFQGNPFPISNRDNFEKLIEYRENLANNLPATFNPSTFEPEDYGIDPQEVIGTISDYYDMTVENVKQALVDKVATKNLDTEQLNTFVDVLNGNTNALSLAQNDFSAIPNLVVANDDGNDSVMIGGEGNDNTFYVPNLNADFTIIDKDGNGQLIIGNGLQSVLLEGNAIPVKDINGNIIPGHWTLNGYDLIQDGDNMVIVPAGSDPALATTPRITINNFPFDAQGAAFGLTLGKVATDEIVQNGIDTNLYNLPIYPLSDKRGRFLGFGINEIGNAIQALRVNIYNMYGEIVRVISLASGSYDAGIPASYADANGKNIRLVTPFNSQSERVGMAVVNTATGEVEASQVFATQIINEDGSKINVDPVGGSTISTSGNNYYLHYVRTYINAAGTIIKLERVVQQFDKTTLAKIGDEILPSAGQISQGEFGGFPSTSLTSPEITLGNGIKVSRNRDQLIVKEPQLRDMAADEIPTDFRVAGNEEANLPAGKVIVTLSEGAIAEIPAANCQYEIRGSRNGKVSLNNLDVNEEIIVASIKGYSVGQFGIPDALGIRDAYPDEDAAQTRRRRDLESDLQALQTGDDALNYSVLKLVGTNDQNQPYNVTLVFPEVNAAELEQNLEQYFIDYEDLAPTQTASQTPTFTPDHTTTPNFVDSTTLGLPNGTPTPQIGGGNNTDTNQPSSGSNNTPAYAGSAGGAALLLLTIIGAIQKWRKGNGDETRRKQQAAAADRAASNAEAGGNDADSWTDGLTPQTIRETTFGTEDGQSETSGQQDYLVVAAGEGEEESSLPGSAGVASPDGKPLDKSTKAVKAKS